MKQTTTQNAVIPQHAKGCSWKSWGGAFAISDKLRVFEADTSVKINEIGHAGDLRTIAAQHHTASS